MSQESVVIVTVDARRRVTLGRLATCHMYIVSVDAGGVIVLTPATVIPKPVVAK